MNPYLLALALICLVALGLVAHRRYELRRLQRAREELRDARQRGSDRARLQHPWIDLSRCIGCGTCVRACPEEGVLDLVHGQAVIVHGSRCVGHGRCAEACPVGAVALTLGDVSERRDLPALEESLEARGVSGLFVAGELGGYALVRTATGQGRAAADAALRYLERSVQDLDSRAENVHDLVVVGAGPAGLSCALRSRELGKDALILEREPELGGTVAQYPRAKLVMTQPMELPLHGRLRRLSYAKEELIQLWQELAEQHELQVELDTRLDGLARDPGGHFVLTTSRGPIRARAVVLALGRRGTPRKLGVPGEERAKVAYHLLDTAAIQGQHVLVIGGGDSAVEAALGLAAQPGNVVTLSYRKADFFRLKARNEKRIRTALANGQLAAVFSSEVESIGEADATLRVGENFRRIRNDRVFVFAGGIPPFGLLENAGVSFDPFDRPLQALPVERGNSLILPLSLSLLSVLAFGAWAWLHADYYQLHGVERGLHPDHRWLAPSKGLGLLAALLGSGAILLNLVYLLRRSLRWGSILPGTLASWMQLHVFTGLLAFLAIFLHAGFAPHDSVGGHAFLALTIVVAAGGIGRYLYSFVPRSANGAEMQLADLRSELSKLGGVQDRLTRGFGEQVKDEVETLIQRDNWKHGLVRRIATLIGSQLALRRTLARLRDMGAADGVPAAEIARATILARRAHRLTLATIHYEELRGLMQSWRYLHRWLALLMVLLLAIHVVVALEFAHLELWPTTGGIRKP